MYFAGSFIIKYMRSQCDQVLTTVFFLPMFRGYCATWISGNAPPSPKSYKKSINKVGVFFYLMNLQGAWGPSFSLTVRRRFPANVGLN